MDSPEGLRLDSQVAQAHQEIMRIIESMPEKDRRELMAGVMKASKGKGKGA